MATLLRKMWKNHSKHRKLNEELILAECEGEGWWHESKTTSADAFDVRYAGPAPVGRAASAPATALAVRNALQNAKSIHKKLQKVNLDISPKGVVVTDAETQANILTVSIYRISYCSADATNARVFALVEGARETHIAHAFLCDRRRHARALALSLAHAFNDAYKAWQANQAGSLSSSKRLAPWVSFPDDDDEEEADSDEAAEDGQWQGLAPLVNFA